MTYDSLRLHGEEPSGAVARFSDEATADTARRFTTTSKVYRNVFLSCTNYAQYLGDSDTQDTALFPMSTMVLDMVDLSTLYFKNYTAGENGTMIALCVEL